MVERVVAWSDIITECGYYKAGFVATFKKYQGQPTDAKDSVGRTIRVTERSFAERNGIPQQTFNVWVKADSDPSWVTTEAKEGRTAVSHANVVKNVARKDPAALVSAIMDAGTGAADQAFHELKLRRAGVDTSKANKKAADASAHAQTQPIRRAMATAHVALCVSALNDATESLKEALSEGAVDEEAMNQINGALEAFQFVMAEARFQVS